MTGFQVLATAPAALVDLDPYRFPAAHFDDWHEETSMVCGGMTDSPLPVPAPSSDLPIGLQSADRRRLELHAALTTAGIAPLPGDLDAIETLCALDDATHRVLRRWLGRRGSI